MLDLNLDPDVFDVLSASHAPTRLGTALDGDHDNLDILCVRSHTLSNLAFVGHTARAKD